MIDDKTAQERFQEKRLELQNKRLEKKIKAVDAKRRTNNLKSLISTGRKISHSIDAL